jgi:uncharacterized protein (DUF433 family)
VNYLDHFAKNPKIMGGQVVLKGTRIPLRIVLASLAEGDSFQDLLGAYPTLTEDHLRAAVAFAAASAVEDIPLPVLNVAA